jgi:nitrate/TMAO reductase-like tetraheme cytochrome c subunit
MEAERTTPQAPVSVWRNWLSLAGSIIASGSIFAFLFLFALDVSGAARSNPYMGILCYVVAPSFLFLGIVLVFYGAIRYRKQIAAQAGQGMPAALSIDLARPRDRKILTAFSVLGGIYLMLTALGSYQTYVYTESDTFCGMVCHSVMGPELTAYQRHAHAKVACVECHVGEGAKSYVTAKINGVRQLYGITFNKFSRPIPTPIHNLRPARETCERCHWPEKHSGNLDRTYAHFLADKTNTPFTVRLLLKVGGSGTEHGQPGGIHWHTSKDIKVEYVAADSQRQQIPWVRVTDKAGKVTIYRKKTFKGEPDPKEIRSMDCIDCHNRPAHNYESPDYSVDEALYLGKLDASLPFLKKTVVDLLSRPYATRAEGEEKITAGLKQAYAGAKQLDSTVAETLAIYRGNFFPEMKVDWSKYPVNIGHLDSAGCFRCHDGDHKSDSGAPMPATSCDNCHVILAQGSGADLAQLVPNGVDFKHPSTDIEGTGLTCADCHNGKNQDQ